MELTKRKLDEDYPFEVKMRFKTEDDAGQFIAGWLDGGLDQMCNAHTYTIKKNRAKQTWQWSEPALYIEIEPFEGNC